MDLIATIWQCVRNGGNATKAQKSRSRHFQQPSSHLCGGNKFAESDKRKTGSVYSHHEHTAEDRISKDAHTMDRTPHQMDRSAVTSTVLVIDDEQSIRDLIRAQLSREGRQVLLASDGQEALEMFRRERPDLTILDLQMPGMTGMEVLRKIRKIDTQAKVIMFTGSYTEDSVREARELGVREFLEKGLSAVWTDRSRRL